MKILIVDDNKNNRLVLRIMMEEFAEKNTCNFSINEAEDGKIAVDLAKNTHFDIIFMDIMMPVMDGLTATKLIHRFDKTTMIIAVSAVEDDERKKVILSNGAEDYLSKPLNGDIFSSRVNNYLHLIESRNSRKLQQASAHNLFSNEVRSFYIHFYGGDEDQISEFWEYYLQDEAQYEDLSDVIRLIYSIGIDLLEQKDVISIYEEQNEKYLFITLESKTPLDRDWIKNQVEKNNFTGNYKIKGSVLSTELEKKRVKYTVPTSAYIDATVQPEIVKKTQPAEPVKKQVFNILEPEDYQDLQEFINRLNSVLLILGSSDIEDHEVDEMITALAGVSKSITSYAELYNIGTAMGKLYKDISEHRKSFMVKSMELGPLAKAFGSDLARWFDSLFVHGASSINFLDDSIISNAQMISAFIAADETYEDTDVDDLFF